MSITANDHQTHLKRLLVGDVTGEFFVPGYQRGYRWGRDEVSRLLDDIWDSGGEDYYLQPVVVRQIGEDRWELIDGQQRLTTLFLIMQYMQRDGLQSTGPAYSLEYQTRPGSETYLHTLDPGLRDTNIDYHHLFEAGRCIGEWFEKHGHRKQFAANKLYGYLFESVWIIWYEAPATVESAELFRRLNVGRIALTDAELVKAHLLTRTRKQFDEHRAFEVASQWDTIERDLRRPELWAFLTGKATQQPTHIDLLLETVAGRPKGFTRPDFFTFETLRPQIEDDSKGFWDRIVDLHGTILGWYDDRDLYHLVGYLAAARVPFDELVRLADGQTRRGFESRLRKRIRTRLALSSDEVADLGYETETSRRRSSDVLLLMNVETIRRNQHSSERYPFRSYAAGQWSLEHIHAQTAESLNREEQWVAWLELHREALAALPASVVPDREGLLARVDEILADRTKKRLGERFREIQPDVIRMLSGPERADAESVHTISNLALLDRDSNAALNNAVFEVKRRRIIELDRSGTYIPVCTRNVFLKYYTDADSQQLHFWGPQDREAYLSAIVDLVGPYLADDGARP